MRKIAKPGHRGRRFLLLCATSILIITTQSYTAGTAVAAAQKTEAQSTKIPNTPPLDGGLPLAWHDFSGDSWSDLVAHQAATGNIYIYPFSGSFNGTATLGAPVLVVAGATDVNWMGVGEVTGDFNPDLIVRKTDGTLWVYPGTGKLAVTGTFDPPIEIGTGWNSLSTLIVGDIAGNGYDGLAGRQSNGNLVVYPHTGDFDQFNTLAPPELIGTGWNIMRWIGAADIASDSETGFPDIVAVDNSGNLDIYPYSGAYSGTTTYTGPIQTGTGWNIIKLLTLMDVTHDNLVDIVGTNSSGQLLVYRYAGGFNGTSTFTGPTVIGTGWDTMDLIA